MWNIINLTVGFLLILVKCHQVTQTMNFMVWLISVSFDTSTTYTRKVSPIHRFRAAHLPRRKQISNNLMHAVISIINPHKQSTYNFLLLNKTKILRSFYVCKRYRYMTKPKEKKNRTTTRKANTRPDRHSKAIDTTKIKTSLSGV